jgi:hypothetical protein
LNGRLIGEGGIPLDKSGEIITTDDKQQTYQQYQLQEAQLRESLALGHFQGLTLDAAALLAASADHHYDP